MCRGQHVRVDAQRGRDVAVPEHLGDRLDRHAVGTHHDVDVDPAEIGKNRVADIPIVSDVREALRVVQPGGRVLAISGTTRASTSTGARADSAMNQSTNPGSTASTSMRSLMVSRRKVATPDSPMRFTHLE